MTTFFDELIKLAGSHIEVKSQEETDRYLDRLQDCFPFTPFGRIDWNNVPGSEEIDSVAVVFQTLGRKSQVLVMWNDAYVSAVRTDLDAFVEYEEDFTAVSFDTWIVSSDFSWVIELFHDGKIQWGRVKKEVS